jgi:hypothetical protein
MHPPCYSYNQVVQDIITHKQTNNIINNYGTKKGTEHRFYVEIVADIKTRN